MKIRVNEHLAPYTTVKVGGYARNFYVPENRDELLDVLNKVKGQQFYILGGGSNVLINDNKVYDNVIQIGEADRSITSLGEGKYYVGASVRLQTLINTINKDGYGGIEYLYSVPGLVGGAIVMNAGRGKNYGQSISDHVVNVHVIDDGQIKVIDRKNCGFSYRSSVFKNSKTIVLGATFAFNKVDSAKAQALVKERIELCKRVQDQSGYNFGSVFMECSGKIMKLVKFIHPGYKNGFCYSKKTVNWLVNKKEGTFDQAVRLIKLVQAIHRILGKRAVPEVIIWE